MTAFELLILGCLHWSALDGSYGSECKWQTTGSLYKTADGCKLVGNTMIGTPIFSDVADGRKVDKFRCSDRLVTE